MKKIFNKATQKDVTSMRDDLRFERYEALARKLHGYSQAKRDAVLERFFETGQGHLIVAQKRLQVCGTSFVEYLAQEKDVVLMRAMVRHGDDHLNTRTSDILFKVYHDCLYKQDTQIMDVIFGEAPWLENDFDSQLSYKRFVERAEADERQYQDKQALTLG